eukprot:717351_1
MLPKIHEMNRCARILEYQPCPLCCKSDYFALAMAKRSANFSDDIPGTRAPTRKRQRLITKRTHLNRNKNHNSYRYIPPNAQTLRQAFEETMTGIEEVPPRQANLEQLINEWNARLNELGIDLSNPSTNTIPDLVSKLEFEDFELMRQITSLSKETLDHAIALRNHSSKCLDIMLDKLQQRTHQKQQQLVKEKAERDQIRMPSKDIWSQSERVNYFREGFKAAIKTEVYNAKSRKKESKYIVTKIMKVNHNKQECVLIDDEDVDVNKHYTRSFKTIVPLPTLSVVSLAKRKVFNAGERVLATYPSTTCFYAAKIIRAPKEKQTKYSLKFEDDDDTIKDIEAEKIIPYN